MTSEARGAGVGEGGDLDRLLVEPRAGLARAASRRPASPTGGRRRSRRRAASRSSRRPSPQRARRRRAASPAASSDLGEGGVGVASGAARGQGQAGSVARVADRRARRRASRPAAPGVVRVARRRTSAAPSAAKAIARGHGERRRRPRSKATSALAPDPGDRAAGRGGAQPPERPAPAVARPPARRSSAGRSRAGCGTRPSASWASSEEGEVALRQQVDRVAGRGSRHGHDQAAGDVVDAVAVLAPRRSACRACSNSPVSSVSRTRCSKRRVRAPVMTARRRSAAARTSAGGQRRGTRRPPPATAARERGRRGAAAAIAAASPGSVRTRRSAAAIAAGSRAARAGRRRRRAARRACGKAVDDHRLARGDGLDQHAGGDLLRASRTAAARRRPRAISGCSVGRRRGSGRRTRRRSRDARAAAPSRCRPSR